MASNDISTKTFQELPTFEQLPVRPGDPPGSAWSLWGDGDELGTLNLLTPQRTAAAGKLIRNGKTFPLNWDLELPDPPLHGRATLQHEIKSLGPWINDDIYHNFNTQSSSQWDGFTHYGNTEFQCYYNGVTAADITAQPGTRNGIHVWARRGITGRGVLIDYARWAERHNVKFDAGTRHEISVAELQAAAREQMVEFQVGDILLVRTGWIEWYLSLDTKGRYDLPANLPHQLMGIGQSEEVLRFLWNNHFAAIAADTVAFEAFPPHSEYGFMHETILALWGMPIGELFYLEKLAEDCACDGIYEFFFASAPLNKLGGVASPPNALAIK